MLRYPSLLRVLQQASKEALTPQICSVITSASSSSFSAFAYGRAFSTASAAVPAAAVSFARLRELAQLYKQLSKAKLSALVVSTTAAGFVAGSGDHIEWTKLWWTYVGTTAAASSANALNQIYEVANDSLMKRTARRPLPTGKISMAHALAFAAVTGIGGVAILAGQTNSLTAGLGAANIVLYAAVYTPLKVVSISNTWVGAIVGAIPPLMGWTAATGQLDPGALVLSATLYLWQMPHFMALAWMCREDYARGGYRMLSRFDPTGRRTAACALRNCMYLLPVGMLAAALGVTTNAFAYESAFITGAMTVTAAAFYSSPTNAAARTLFRASLLHLPLFMAALLVHRVPRNQQHAAEWQVSLANPSSVFAASPVLRSLERSHAAQGAMRTICVAPFPFLPVPTESVSWSSQGGSSSDIRSVSESDASLKSGV
ncbi:hypothetical protein WJX77_010961 [Trebouxia sp. C0004]